MTEGKDERNDDEKNIIATLIVEEVIVLYVEEKNVSMLPIMMLNGLLIRQPPTVL